MLAENRYFSYNLKELPRGCQYCVRGEKLVLFVTGLCPRHCYFCPLSDQKYQQDVTFANERPVIQEEDIFTEARLMDARGAGITGGDPLMKMERTISYLKKLKETFGKNFHLHLYTSLDLVTEEKLQQLFEAGLDEIRFHLDLDSSTLWPKLELARKFSWDVGIEVPLIPTKEKQLQQVIDYVQDKVNFLNLNELEVADNSHSQLLSMGFTPKDQLSYTVKGSLELGLKLLDYIQEKKYDLKTHLCTAKLKDAVQLANRIKREAQHAKKEFDLVDKEGLLTRGALYLAELAPSFGYRNKLEIIKKEKFLSKLESLAQKIKEKLKLKETEIFVDHRKPRILLSSQNLRKYRKEFRKMKLLPAIVKEYPTADQLEIEVEFLN